MLGTALPLCVVVVLEPTQPPGLRIAAAVAAMSVTTLLALAEWRMVAAPETDLLGTLARGAGARQAEPMTRVRQLRVVVEAEDYEEAVAFFRDTLGLPEAESYSGPGEAAVVILDAGRATLELANPAQKRMIDEVEVGRQVAPKIRLAFEVGETSAVTDALVAGGARLVAPPTPTPWGSLNSRLDVPAGLHVTIFAEGSESY